jgi:3-carboxy-cis,cis-muconate cycloisomerase
MSNPMSSSHLYGPLFASPAMRAICADAARLQRMLDVEAALARATAAQGLIPDSAAAAIGTACAAEGYDLNALAQAAASAGNLAFPVISALTAKVAQTDAQAARYVHWGATSQDIIDTALMLELRAGINALLADLTSAITCFTALAEHHRTTPIAGRTLLQHAVPIPLGLKLAGYAAAFGRSRDRLQRLQCEAIALQFGGAAGTLAALGASGLSVAQALAAELGLRLPDAPWHSHRDRGAEIGAALAILAGSCGKVARDVTLLMQTEVAEAFESGVGGRGGSSTMPQKRNPVGATLALAAATIAPNLAATIFAALVGEHERAAGAWQSEWLTFPALLLVVSGALGSTLEIAQDLQIDGARMRDNLNASNGQIMAEAVMMALASKIGRHEAHELVGAASRRAASTHRHLKDVLADDATVSAHLDQRQMACLFDPLAYQGAAQTFIDRQILTITGPAGR